eukprot:Em0007g1489a
MRFVFSIVHVPGINMYTADALSRAPTGVLIDSCIEFQKEVESHIAAVIETLLATKQQLDKYRHAQAADVLKSCLNGCVIETTETGTVNKLLQIWLASESQASTEPETLLDGEGKADTARSTPPVEPMIASKLPDYLWQKVGADVFELEGIKLVDYFSNYIEIIKLTSTTSGTIIFVLKTVFSRYGIPEQLISDNGPQFASREMNMFSTSYGFEHVMSIPHYPQENGQAERAVQTTKRLLSTRADPALSLLSYRTTAKPWRSTRHLVAIPTMEEHQEAEHQPSLDADQDVIPELPAPAPVPELPVSAPVRDPTMTRSITGTRINCPLRYWKDK